MRQLSMVSAALWLLPCFALQLSGCKENNQPATKPPEPPTPANLQEPYVIIADTVMRLVPSEEAVVPVPATPTRQARNYIGNITKGHVGTLTQRVGYWSHVVLDDDAEGWVKSEDMLPARQVSEATVLRRTTLFGVASFEAPPAGVLNPGDLVFVSDEEGEFSKVYGTSPSPAYVETAALNTQPSELAMSHMLVKMRLAHAVNDVAEASEIYDEARINFPKTKLMEVLAENVDFLHTNAVPHTEDSRFRRLPPVPPTN